MSERTAYGHLAIWSIAGPMILSNISTPLVGLVDTGLMGHLDSPEFLAAVAAGTSIFNVLFISLNFLRMATTGTAAQAFGSADAVGMVRSLVQPVAIAIAIGLGLVALQRPLLDLALVLLGVSADTARLTEAYFAIRIFSSPAALANFVIIGWLLGMQNAHGPLAIMLTINTINVALDVVLVVWLGMDVRGVAFATLVAEVAGVAVGLWFVRQCFRQFSLPRTITGLRDTAAYRKLVSINTNLFVRTLALMFTFAFITAQGARLGDVVLAANALLLNFQFFLAYALDGIAHAAEALSGKAAGARDRKGLEITVARTLNWTMAFTLAFSLAYAAGGRLIIDSLTSLSEIRTTAYAFLPWMAVLPFLSAGAFLYDGVFVGLTRSADMRHNMVGSLVLVFLPAWWLSRDLGNHGLWLAFTLFMASRSIAMHLRYRQLQRRAQLLA